MDQHPDSLPALVDHFATRVGQHKLLNLLFSEKEAEFDMGLESLLERAVGHLERNANHLFCLGEEAISAFLVAFLSIPGLYVTQEAHSNGHVDITIEPEGQSLRRRLGEAKIYNGARYHVKGLEQLVGRYSTGREGLGLIIEYVKEPNIKGLVEKIRIHLDQIMPCTQQGKTDDHTIRWAFVSNHLHESGEVFKVFHLNCNLYRVP